MDERNDKPNHENKSMEDNENQDIIELTDAFLSFMDDVIKEDEEKIKVQRRHESPVKSTLPDLTSPFNADILNQDETFDENELADRFESGFFEQKDDDKEQDSPEIFETLSENREKRIFYAALYLSGKPIEIATFRKMLNPINLENRLLSYSEDFNKMRMGVRIRMVSGGYQVVTDSDVTGFLEKYFGERTESLSRASLETAAIIAYRQPVTKAEVEEMREVNSSGTMKYLLDKNLIKVVGRKQVPGKPLLYATTKYFLEYFGLNDLSELPTFREWQELKQNQ